jgi:tetratricopeptide (TPR) repeat protein
MKLQILPLVLLTFLFSISSFSQDSLSTKIKRLLDNKEYDEIIASYVSESKDLSAKSLYYIGIAYYMKADDNNCVKFMDLSIKKDSKYPKAYFFKASTLNYLNKFKEAIINFRTAISLDSTDWNYYSGLGDSYYNLEEKDSALGAYKKAAEFKDSDSRPYLMIAQIYSQQGKNKYALETYYVAKSKTEKGTSSYINSLFNIGLFEYLYGSSDKAESAFLEIIQLDPNDFHCYAKLIQVYYGRKEYEKAKSYKAILYKAHKDGLLKDNMEDMFCFDQFEWKDKHIQAFERFEQGPKKQIYNKHIFYVKNEKDSVEFKIQTEYSPISVETGSAKYLLCLSKGKMHATYNVGFNDDLNYDELKKYVIYILEEKIKPVASSRPGN